ncbi:hypothetical protein TVAG_283700 [Trichomonas vaginalis G3]|uniref:DUF3447 domain-containing protein n=1 Tax=Trichomonas vaginalis (strain ATCC PRA-98 / G3) TaxID=412133 RepID=A2DES4_TRIV3|nr:spectrin binding [Trichomonas vaginalis G3]EAY21201.1 hypothetical protein TVAG_283700 [Trichomonas vaginalis G3]KAI5522269.1 spectrin binding [Trichomonas vaginalis G3]|eukprot:XP_001582187.1 hypothetical protein [Trichomonas vaginalis G3]
MSEEYLKLYDDFIMAYEKLYHLQSDQPIDEVFNLINTILVDKYNISLFTIIGNMIYATRYNFRSCLKYLELLNQFFKKYSIAESDVIAYCPAIYPEFDFFANMEEICQFRFWKSMIKGEDSIEYIIMHDLIDKFKDYSIRHQIDEILINSHQNSRLSLIEACAIYGSVNIFYFIHLNMEQEITQECLQCSIIGGNVDIINECLKFRNLDKVCLINAIMSHNNNFLEHILRHDVIQKDVLLSIFDSITDIIESQNLKAFLLFFEKDKNTAIPWCVGFPQIVEILNDDEIDFLKVDDDNWNILHYAAVYNNIDICGLLLCWPEIFKKLINSKTCDESLSPIHILITEGKSNTLMISFLLNGADVNAKDSSMKTPLHYAASENNVQLAFTLLKFGAEINAKDENECTPLHLAFYHNCNDMITLLISQKADVNAKDINGETPLNIAIYRCDLYNVIILLKFGANVIEKNKSGLTALHLAASEGYSEIAVYLIFHGANINILSSNGRTPLHLAAEAGKLEMVLILISYGADISIKDNHGNTAFDCSLDNDFTNVSNYFIRIGVDIDEKNEKGKTRLHQAIDEQNKFKTIYLIKSSASVQVKDLEGKTPLHYTTINKYLNRYEIMEELISNGAIVNEKDNDGKTALYYAELNHDKNAVDILIKHGAQQN